MRIARAAQHPARVAAFTEAVLLFAGAELALRLAGLERVAQLFGATLEFSDEIPRREGSRLELSPSDRRTLSILARVARHWPFGPGGACLRHSLAAAHVLRSMHPRLRLAVGSGSMRELTAHAWVEVDRVAITNPANLRPLLLPGSPGKEERS